MPGLSCLRSLFPLLCVLLLGCEGGLPKPKLPGIPTADDLRDETRDAQKHRERFRATGDVKAVRWLLANRVRQGMSLDDVNRILGRDGRRVYADARYKSLNDGVRRSDETYEWRTADESIILFFRKDRLVVHRPKQYAD